MCIRDRLRELIHIADHPRKVGSRLLALRLINLQMRKLSDIGNKFIVDFHIFILSSLKLDCFGIRGNPSDCRPNLLGALPQTPARNFVPCTLSPLRAYGSILPIYKFRKESSHENE